MYPEKLQKKLLKEIKENLNKWKEFPVHRLKYNIGEIAIFYTFKQNPF